MNQKLPMWLKRFAGRTLTRACPIKDESACERCYLRVLCKCAQADLAAAAAVERRVWLVLALCGAATIAYAMYASLS